MFPELDGGGEGAGEGGAGGGMEEKKGRGVRSGESRGHIAAVFPAFVWARFMSKCLNRSLCVCVSVSV